MSDRRSVLECKFPLGCTIAGVQVQPAGYSRSRSENGLVALGNPLREDDGVGLAVLQSLAALPGELPLVLLDCSPGELLDVLIGWQFERLVIVDAAELGLQAGRWLRFHPAQAHLVRKSGAFGGAEHRMGLAEALALGATLSLLPSEIWIYAVQPLRLGWGQDLSPPVQAAVTEICSAILSDLAAFSSSKSLPGVQDERM